jgi:tripartite ATP-independent transporter DctP family solute receptor
MKTRFMLLLTCAVALTMINGGFALAATKVKFAHVYETSEPYHKRMVEAAAIIKKRTEGRYDMEVFPASSLGKEIEINQGLALGTVDIIYTGNLFAGKSYGPLSIAGAPYMFRDLAHWRKYTTSDLFKELGAGYTKATGNHIVAHTYYGRRHATSNKPLNSCADMKNLKIRVPNAPLYMMFPKACEANATPIAFAEVYLALQQGVVDAQENPLPTIKAKKFYEVQKYINLTGHISDSLLTIIGGPFWGKLSETDRAIFTEELEAAALKASQDIVDSENSLASWFEAQGVTVNKVDITPFREATMKLHNGPDATWSQDVYDRLQAIK